MEMDFERVVTTQAQMERGNSTGDREVEMELANEVYIFYDKNKPGIRFFIRNPEEGTPEGKFAGLPPEGVYYTEDIHEAQWDDGINVPGETIPVRYKNGSNKVTTIMVSEEEMKGIVEQFEEDKKKGSFDGKIRVDLRQRGKTSISRLARESIKKMENTNIKEEIKLIDDWSNIKFENQKELNEFDD